MIRLLKKLRQQSKKFKFHVIQKPNNLLIIFDHCIKFHFEIY